MAGKVEVIKASLFDADRERIKLMIQKYTAEGKSMAGRFTTFFYGMNPIIVAYYAMVMNNAAIPMNLVDKVNRALSGLVVSEDILRSIEGPDADWLPILVVDTRFTGKACVPFVMSSMNEIEFVALNLSQFVESFGINQLEELKGI